MELSNEFEVAAPIERTWAVLTDLERIAPCLPGAQLQEVEGDEHRGVIKVKVGPITAQYKGKAVFVERDDAAHQAVLQADGRDTRGQGNAAATITARLAPTDGGTHVRVDTDLTVTGKVAQFGRGVMADVSTKLMAQFVENLEQTVLADDVDAPAEVDAPADADVVAPGDEPEGPGPEDAPAPAPDAPVVRTIDAPEAAPLDLMEVAGARTMAKIAVPAVVLVVILVGLLVLALR
ncbi:MAG: SRPBCC family protein [Acidimicrobiales bacterium]|nr:SRPBCC family protein [Acidimicrobiales bacterium]MCB9372313.1 SRPBCC family protein [Microthrixaceae bacterium]